VVEYTVALVMTCWLSLKVLVRHGFDVIHVANPPDIFFIVGMCYRLLGKKFVFDQHDLAPELFQALFKRNSRLLYRLMVFLEWCTYKMANLVLVTNESQRRNAIERGSCDDGKLVVVRNGPNLEQLKPVSPEPGLKNGWRYVLGYVGIMGVQDGVEYALRALYELVYRRGRRDVGLILMGEGESLCMLQALAHELGLDEYINFTGWIPIKDVARYLSVADICLIPDPLNGVNEYSTMLKTMEYMAMGKPIVAFDLYETRYSAGEAALYAVPNLASDFANKIEVLLGDEALRCRMGTIGRRRVEEELSWEHSRKNLLRAYETCFARRK
jgi:glycosyltransferase involved in cell wall biosynthesis